MAIPDDLQTLIVLAGMLTIPGWFLLTVSGAAHAWRPLQRWILAVGLSIAFYPVLMYFLRLIPAIRMGTAVWLLLLAFMGLVVLWGNRKNWRGLLQFDPSEWLAIAIFLVTLFTRLWLAKLNPYPAWTDSLHHVLLTQLTAQLGRLPSTLEPFGPAPLDMYHLGLYAISGTVSTLARVPAHTALLWTAQALNGLCGLGIYLVLDRKVGRVGAVAGAAVVGLFSFQPAWYVNWGRFTQVSSQSILLMAWLLTWETVELWRKQLEKDRALWGMALASALLTAGVFLLHFRVAYFYLPLLAVSLLFELRQAVRSQTTRRYFLALLVIGLLSVLLVSPSLFTAVQSYYNRATGTSFVPPDVQAHADQLYYAFQPTFLTDLGVQPWLLAVWLLAFAYSLYRKLPLTWVVLIWVGLLLLEGITFIFGISVLNVVNMGAVAIMFYLPLGLIVGQSADRLWREPWLSSQRVHQAALGLFLFAAFIAGQLRTGNLDTPRYFVTPYDVQAMAWIRENTPEDALFAINTDAWIATQPRGIDGGYWIPYFTGRRTTADTMLFSLGPDDHARMIYEHSQAVMAFRDNPVSLDGLCQIGVDYIYLGVKGSAMGKTIDFTQLLALPGADLLYFNNGASVFQVCQ